MFLWELCLFLSNTVSTGHIGDGAIKRLLDSVITSGIWLSLENYNCSVRRSCERPGWQPETTDRQEQQQCWELQPSLECLSHDGCSCFGCGGQRLMQVLHILCSLSVFVQIIVFREALSFLRILSPGFPTRYCALESYQR